MEEEIKIDSTCMDDLEACGSVGFSAEEVAAIFDFDPAEVKRQFADKKGAIWETYYKGRLQSELNIRKAILKSAENGSTPSQNKMMELYDMADREIMKLKSQIV